MIRVDNKCTGCNLCIAVCPIHAITVSCDKDGFWYPLIDEALCIDCNVCEKMCPVYSEMKFHFDYPQVFAAWNSDDEVRFESSSGGLFYAIASIILEGGGAVYGAAYEENYHVCHIRVDKVLGLKRLRGSKYVQSFISEEIYKLIDCDLKSERMVLFSGTPCQSAAVKNKYIHNKNLITLDVICHGVPSPKAWERCIAELSMNGDITSVNMRDKSNGWNNFRMVVNYSNGEGYSESFNDSIWGKAFINNLFLRNCCYSCRFKEKIRTADISLGDFWGAARGAYKEYDDHDKGTSLIMVNSHEGQEIIKRLTNCVCKKISYKYIDDNIYAVFRSSKKNINREKAFSSLERRTFSRVVNRYCNSGLSAILKRVKDKILQNIGGGVF